MKILVLEDDGSIASSIKRNFEPRHSVHTAYSIYDTLEIMESEIIDLYIIDLNLDPDGLSIEEQKETVGGMFTGWIFIKNHLLKKDPTLALQHRIVVYSDYLDPFRKHITDKKSYENILLFDKTHDSADRVIKDVRNILENLLTSENK